MLALALPSARDVKTAGYVLQSDDAHLFGKGPVRFERAVDLWPERVELATAAGAAGFSYAILTGIDPVSMHANIYVGRGKDAFAPDRASSTRAHAKSGASRNERRILYQVLHALGVRESALADLEIFLQGQGDDQLPL